MSEIIHPSREFGQHIILNHKATESGPDFEKYKVSLALVETQQSRAPFKVTLFPTSFSLLTKYKLNILDQGALGSCVVTSYAGIIASTKKIVVSRLYLYFNARVGCGMSPTEDTGLNLLPSYPIFKSFGLPLESNWPYVISKFSVLPDYSKTYKVANTTTVVNISVILQTDSAIKTALTAGKFVMFGFNVYSSFMSNAVAQTGIIPIPNTSSETQEGGHCVHIVGWCSFNNVSYYIIRNSWGVGWGNDGAAIPTVNFKNNGRNGGFGYMPTSYVLDKIKSTEFLSIS